MKKLLVLTLVLALLASVGILAGCSSGGTSSGGQTPEQAVQAFFDAANSFAGCIAGLHEVLRRQGLLERIWCLNPKETLGPGQREEIDRVYEAYPHLNDDEFVAAHRDEWLR